jgi:hypothetical protein
MPRGHRSLITPGDRCDLPVLRQASRVHCECTLRGSPRGLWGRMGVVLERIRCWILIWSVAACGPVRDPAVNDGGGTHDSSTQECQADMDCATPPDRCSMPGTCDLETHRCEFPSVACPQFDSDCTIGTCDLTNGACVAMPRNEGASCGSGIVCGQFGTCGGFADVCAENGKQSRTCTANTCQAGMCVGMTTTEVADCQRPTENMNCGSQPRCMGCVYPGECANTGSDSCTCVQKTCMSGACGVCDQSSCPPPSPCTFKCHRDTTGAPCNLGRGHCENERCETNS